MRAIDQILLAWVAMLSALAIALFGWDKFAAKRGGTRISEFKLVLIGALGGWLGGLLAMSCFRHKTEKLSFQIKYAFGLLPMIAAGWIWWHWRF